MDGFSGRSSHSSRDTRRIDARRDNWNSRRAANASLDAFDILTGRAPRDPYRDPDPPRGHTRRRNPISDWNHEPRRKSNKTRNNRSASVAMGTALTLALIGSANLSSKHQRLTTMNNLKKESKRLNDETEKVDRLRTHIQKMSGQPGGGYLSRDKSVELEKLTTRAFGRDDAPSILRRLSKPSYRRSSHELDVIEEGGDGSVYNKDEVDHVLKTLNINREINKQQKKNLQSATRREKKTQKYKTHLTPHHKYRHQQSHRGGNRNTRRTSR